MTFIKVVDYFVIDYSPTLVITGSWGGGEGRGRSVAPWFPARGGGTEEQDHVASQSHSGLYVRRGPHIKAPTCLSGCWFHTIAPEMQYGPAVFLSHRTKPRSGGAAR